LSSKCTKPQWSPGSSEPHSCGGCIACRTRKQNQWKVRCVHEASYWPASCFATLTYNDENLPPGKTLEKSDLQNFYKRLRTKLSRENPPRKIKHYSAGEYGDPSTKDRNAGDRPHYHAIIFGVSEHEVDLITETWGLGFVKMEPMNEATAAYVAGYVYKKYSDDLHQEKYGTRIRPFQTSSNGIGREQCLDNWKQYKSHGYMTLQGIKYALPDYYKKLIGIDPEVREKFIKESKEKRDAEYKALGLDYFSKEAIQKRRDSRRQTEKNIRAKMALDADRKASNHRGKR